MSHNGHVDKGQDDYYRGQSPAYFEKGRREARAYDSTITRRKKKKRNAAIRSTPHTVELSQAKASLRSRDCPGKPTRSRNMITGAPQLAGAISVVSAADGFRLDAGRGTLARAQGSCGDVVS